MKKVLSVSFVLIVFSLSSQLFAEGGGKGGDEFRKTAENYDNKSEMYRSKGKTEVASLYARQADIKQNAAELADKGLWNEIDWTEYHANEARINKLLHDDKIEHAKK